jgi:hypothetical protein
MKESIDWKKKLTSRKFWAAVCALATNIIMAFGGTEDTTVKMTALIMAGATVIGYTIGEGLADGHGERSDHGHSTGHAESAGYAESTDYAESTSQEEPVDCS